MKWVLCFFIGLGMSTLVLQAQPVITNGPTCETVLNGSNATFTVGVTGTGPFTYQWQFNGTNIPNNIISTVAGTNVGGFLGDGGSATNAKIDLPFGVAADSLGNFYIADTYNSRIRKVNANGIITTVAGNGSTTYGGDGGLATNAALYHPNGVAVDSLGNLFIADTGNNRIRRVDTNGNIWTVAGTNSTGFGGDGGSATNATLNGPRAVAVDGIGNLYIADTVNNRIREVNTNGIIMTVAGTNRASFSGDGGTATNASLDLPEGVTVDGYGRLFIADTSDNRIREVNTNGIIATVAGTNGASYSGDSGAATNANLNMPTGMAIDAFGYLFIADTSNNRIRQVDLNGIITTVAGNGSSGNGGAVTNAQLSFPTSMAFDVFGGLFIADEGNSRIRSITLGRNPVLSLNDASSNNVGNYQVIVTCPSGSVTSSIVNLSVVFPPAISSQPQSVVVTNGNSAQLAITASGTTNLNYQWYFDANALLNATNLAITFSNATSAEAGNYQCVITNNYGSMTSFVATLTVLTPPVIICQSTNQVVLYGTNVILNVAMSGTGPFIYQWQFNGTNLPNGYGIITRAAGGGSGSSFSGDGGVATSASLWSPSGVTVDSFGDIFIADLSNERIRMVNTNYVNTTNGPIGIMMTIAGNGGSGYSGDGVIATNTKLDNPQSVAVDGLGNFYIADTSNNRIREVNTNGIISTLAGTNAIGFSGDGGPAINAELYAPQGVAVDGWGNVFIADTHNNRIREINTNGIITTVAGTNAPGFLGDGGFATNAELNLPSAVAVDAAGNLFIADNNRIRKVDVNGIITTLAGTNSASYSGDGGPATNASLNGPDGVAVDAYDDVFISDLNNFRIRMVNVQGAISTVAGNGTSGNTGDGGVATNATIFEPGRLGMDSYGNLFFPQSLNSTVRKVGFGGVSALQLNDVWATNTGNYDVIVTSPYGSVTSSIISLTVLSPPMIVIQPTNATVPVGSLFNEIVVVTNDPPFRYQWFTASGRPAIAVAAVSGYSVNQITILDTGQGYVSVPNVSLIGGGGTGATATAVLAGSEVSRIYITNPGNLYTSPPVVQIDAPPSVNTGLLDETNATLTFSPITGADSTNYFVAITNNYGSVTSATVAVFAFLPPQNFTAQYTGTAMLFVCMGTPFYLYTLQSATNLTPPINWVPFYYYVVADSNGNWTFTDTNLNTVQKYYRVKAGF